MREIVSICSMRDWHSSATEIHFILEFSFSVNLNRISESMMSGASFLLFTLWLKNVNVFLYSYALSKYIYFMYLKLRIIFIGNHWFFFQKSCLCVWNANECGMFTSHDLKWKPAVVMNWTHFWIIFYILRFVYVFPSYIEMIVYFNTFVFGFSGSVVNKGSVCSSVSWYTYMMEMKCAMVLL